MATAIEQDVAIERDAAAWMEDPYAYFGESSTRIHSIERAEAETIQLAALNMRLEERREQIPVLAKLADGQGIARLASLDDAAPLLFTHDIYKSYPVSLLAKQRFDQLTTWLDRLTRYDIAGVDVSSAVSIDSWLTLLQQETPLDVATSSGTSGTISLFPKSKRDYITAVKSLRVQLVQTFGQEPNEGDLHEKIHVLTPLYRDGHSSMGRFAQYLLQVMCRGDDSYLHTAFPYKISSDLMWLAARIRAAAAKGDASRVDVPETLLARKGEWEAMQRDMPGHQSAFVRRVAEELKGERVFAMGMTNMFYQVAKQGLDDGVHAQFAPGSVVMGGGGHKGMVLPEDTDQVIMDFFGVKQLRSAYGMTEQNGFMVSCEADHYHLLPWVTLFLLDLDSGQPLPRQGRQTGRAGFFDPTHDGTWGGVLTGDLVTAEWDEPCACGRKTVWLHKKIQRVSEAQGGDDKITCAATPEAQGDAMEFLLSL